MLWHFSQSHEADMQKRECICHGIRAELKGPCLTRDCVKRPANRVDLSIEPRAFITPGRVAVTCLIAAHFQGIGDRYAASAFRPRHPIERSPLRGYPAFSHSLSHVWGYDLLTEFRCQNLHNAQTAGTDRLAIRRCPSRLIVETPRLVRAQPYNTFSSELFDSHVRPILPRQVIL